jgi:colicin import membrane protein
MARRARRQKRQGREIKKARWFAPPGSLTMNDDSSYRGESMLPDDETENQYQGSYWDDEAAVLDCKASKAAEGRELLLCPRIADPATVFVPNGTVPLVAHVQAEVDKLRPELDISSPKGRRQVNSVARRIGASWRYIDEVRLGYKKALSGRINEVDAEGKRCKETLTDLQEEIRRPLTEWETQDKRRKDEHEAKLAELTEIRQYQGIPTAADIKSRLAKLTEYEARQWDEFRDRAAKVIGNVRHFGEIDMAEARKREAEAAELARLRQEALERAQREHDAEVARKADERARLEAEAAARAASERADREHQAFLRQVAEHEAKVKADAERQTRELAEREAQAAEERARKAEADRIEVQAMMARVSRGDPSLRQEVSNRLKAENEALRKLEADRKAARDQEIARSADEHHRQEVHAEIVKALMAEGFNRDDATFIVQMIDDDKLPNVSINY